MSVVMAFLAHLPFVLALQLAISIAPTFAGIGLDPLVATTKLGSARGQYADTWSGDRIRVWKGLPFGRSTAGERRFRPPEPADVWNGTLNATAFGPTCPQVYDPTAGGIHLSEDCLHLSIWAPKIPPTKPLPVLVNFCGGGYKYGAMSFPGLDGGELISTAEIIYVSPNFRVGLLGFLALPELMKEDPQRPTTGNYGMQDQRLALLWVRDNIAAFGGDPSKIIIGGVSSGGGNVVGHATSLQTPPGLLYAVSPESPMPTWYRLEVAVKHGKRFVKDLGCSRAKDVPACLRRLPVEHVQKYDDSNVLMPFPVIDGFEWDRQPVEMAMRFSGPAFVGHTTMEGTLFATMLGAQNLPQWMVYALVVAIFNVHAFRLFEIYEPRQSQAEYGKDAGFEFLSNIIGDLIFTCPTRSFAQSSALQGHETFYWIFGEAPSCDVVYGLNFTHEDVKRLGAYHGITIPYFEGNTLNGTKPTCLREGNLGHFWNTTHGYFANFISHGNPNGPTLARNTVQPMFPRYSGGSDGQRKMLTRDFTNDTTFKQGVCDYWDRVGVEGMVKKLLWWEVALSRLAQLFTSRSKGGHSVGLHTTWSNIAKLDEAAFQQLLKRASEEWTEYEQRTEIIV